MGFLVEQTALVIKYNHKLTKNAPKEGKRTSRHLDYSDNLLLILTRQSAY